MSLVWSNTTANLDWLELEDLYRRAPLGNKSAALLQTVFENSRYKWFVRDAGRLVAAGRALADGADCSYICDVAVLPSHQGTGLGKEVVAKLVDDSHGYKKIILYSVPGKEGFYRKLGFLRLLTAMAIFQDRGCGHSARASGRGLTPRSRQRPATAATAWPLQAKSVIVLPRPSGVRLRGRLSSNVRPHRMHPLLAIQVLLGTGAAVAMVYLWRSGMPEPDDRRWHGFIFAGAFTAIITIWTVPLAALAISGVKVAAKVTKLECPDRAKRYVYFEYMAGAHALQGTAQDLESPFACETLTVGAMDSVTYLPSRPEVHAWRSPWPNLRFNLFISIFALVACPLIAVAGRGRRT